MNARSRSFLDAQSSCRCRSASQQTLPSVTMLIAHDVTLTVDRNSPRVPNQARSFCLVRLPQGDTSEERPTAAFLLRPDESLKPEGTTASDPRRRNSDSPTSPSGKGNRRVEEEPYVTHEQFRILK